MSLGFLGHMTVSLDGTMARTLKLAVPKDKIVCGLLPNEEKKVT